MTQHDREKWDRKYAETNLYQDVSGSPLLSGLLSNYGSALDVAGGAGRHAVWLAKRGMDVTIVDVAGGIATGQLSGRGVWYSAFSLSRS